MKYTAQSHNYSFLRSMARMQRLKVLDLTFPQKIAVALIPKIDNWLIKINGSPEPPAEIIAYYFGLFEAKGFYVLYLIGSPEFDADDDDWKYEIGYEPTPKYLHLQGPDWNGLKPSVVLEKVLAHLKQSAQLCTGIFTNAEAIAVGFDDGDLLIVR